MAKQFEAEYKQMQEKFSALTDEQKKEIYDLYDKVNVAKIKLLDKYVELGLMTDEEGQSPFKNICLTFQKVIRSEGQFIGFKAPHFPKRAENNQQNSQDVE